MMANELFFIEHGNQNEIHLFLAGHFWQAWEKSAYYFTKFFECYEVHGKFIKKISAEMVYLGFSKEALENVCKKCSRQNFTITQVDEKHLIISGFTPYSGFEQWKRDVYEKSLKKRTNKSAVSNRTYLIRHKRLRKFQMLCIFPKSPFCTLQRNSTNVPSISLPAPAKHQNYIAMV